MLLVSLPLSTYHVCIYIYRIYHIWYIYIYIHQMLSVFFGYISIMWGNIPTIITAADVLQTTQASDVVARVGAFSYLNCELKRWDSQGRVARGETSPRIWDIWANSGMANVIKDVINIGWDWCHNLNTNFFFPAHSGFGTQFVVYVAWCISWFHNSFIASAKLQA